MAIKARKKSLEELKSSIFYKCASDSIRAIHFNILLSISSIFCKKWKNIWCIGVRAEGKADYILSVSAKIFKMVRLILSSFKVL